MRYEGEIIGIGNNWFLIKKNKRTTLEELKKSKKNIEEDTKEGNFTMKLSLKKESVY